jgi:N-acetylglucosamine-6-phosphate deacetylase
MLIKNAKVYTEQGEFKEQDIWMEDGFFSEKRSRKEFNDTAVVDASGLFAVPGLTDIHFHGCVGHDFCDATEEAISAIAEYEAANGITTICPATMTMPEETLLDIAHTAANHKNESGSILVGINMEGPFISHEKKGAQKDDYIVSPNLTMYRKFQEASNHLVKIVDVAPETEGALEFIRAVKKEAVVSIAHTTADYDLACKALTEGASHITHLYNAMPPYTHRNPGVVGAASDSKTCEVELICDGIHIHPAVVRNTFKMFGPDRVILISDSMMAAGMKNGEYSLGGQKVIVTDKRAVLGDGTIAGSASNLMECVRVCVKSMGISLEQAIRSAAVNSAKSIGIYEQYGSITPGKVANLVLLDEYLNVVQVYLKGRRIK